MKTNFRSFAGGEISPEMYGRLDLTRYQTGLSLCRNFMVLPHGPVTRRPGTTYVNEARFGRLTSTKVRLIPFSFNATQTMVLELGDYYIRFHTSGSPLLEASRTVSSSGNTVSDTAHPNAVGDWIYLGGRYYKVASVLTNSYTVVYLDGSAVSGLTATNAARVYTVVSPWAESEVFNLRYTQSADVLTVVGSGIPIYEIRRLGSTNWTCTAVSFAPTISAPGSVTATATVPHATDTTTQSYGATAIAADGVTESTMSKAATCTNNLGLAGNFNTIATGLVTGALRYNFYKLRAGTYGYIGTTTGKPATTVAITTIVEAAGRWASTATVTTAVVHGFSPGDYVSITETGGSDFEGGWTISSCPTTTTFIIPCATTGGTTYSGGNVGKVTATSIIDDNITPNTAVSPPGNTFASTLNVSAATSPQAVAYYEQRRWFASTQTSPQNIWATRSGTETNLTYSIPAADADAMNFRLAATKQNAIQHLVPLNDLLALTAGGEFRIYTENGNAISPTNITVKPQGALGASSVQPVVTNRSAVYAQASGIRLLDIGPGGPNANYGYMVSDLNLMATHFFNANTNTIKDICYAQEPDKTVWVVGSAGYLYGLTYVPDQQVYAWHQHPIAQGLVESACVVTESNRSVLYLVVNRPVNGVVTRTIERMASRVFSYDYQAYYVDCGLTYSGAAATTFSGLWHLEGQIVSVLADGADVGPKTVSGGTITLSVAASNVSVGLSYNSDLTTLPLTLEGMAGEGRGTVKNVNRVFVRVSQSMMVQAGPSFSKLQSSVPTPVSSLPSKTGEIALTVSPNWNPDAAICIRQSGPLPLTVVSMALDVVTGG